MSNYDRTPIKQWEFFFKDKHKPWVIPVEVTFKVTAETESGAIEVERKSYTF